jgi:hypothetical protein
MSSCYTSRPFVKKLQIPYDFIIKITYLNLCNINTILLLDNNHSHYTNDSCCSKIKLLQKLDKITETDVIFSQKRHQM